MHYTPSQKNPVKDIGFRVNSTAEIENANSSNGLNSLQSLCLILP